MNTFQKGSAAPLLIVFALIIVGAGVYFTNAKKTGPHTPPNVTPSSPTSTNPVIENPTKPIGNVQTKPATSTPSNTITSEKPAHISTSHSAFGFTLIKNIARGETGDNIFISPSSIALALSMALNGAKGETKVSMEKTLNLQGLDIATVNRESLGLMNSLKNSDPKVQLSIANSVWARKNVTFNADFTDTLKNYFGAESSVLDFAKLESIKTINSWVSKRTNGKISSIIDKIPNDTVMYILNAVYFKGSWTKEFDKKLTQNKQFIAGNDSAKMTPFMEKSDKIPYLETDSFQSVNLSYGDNGRISMYVFLPKHGIEDFISSLSPAEWNTWMKSYEKTQGTISLPKFKIEYEKQLKDNLSDLGMGIAFSDLADFSGIGDQLKISEVKHKSFIDVNEEGTEAAAVTSIGISLTSVAMDQKTFYMEVNHPFFFVIQDNLTGEILFMGVIRNP